MAEKINFLHKIMGDEYIKYLSSAEAVPEQKIIRKIGEKAIKAFINLTNHSETETLDSGEKVEFEYSLVQEKQKDGQFTVNLYKPSYHITAKVNDKKVADCYYDLSSADYPGKLGFGIKLIDKNFERKGIEEKLIEKIERVAENLNLESMNTVYGAFEGTSISGEALEALGYREENDHVDRAVYFIKQLKALEFDPNVPQGPNQ